MVNIVCSLSIMSFCSIVTLSSFASSQESTKEDTLVVATRDVPPFCIKRSDGTWGGLSIELWREIAAENNWDFELREMGLQEALEAIAKGEVDVGEAAITVTPEREALVDFSHPYYLAGLGVAVRKVSTKHWLSDLIGHFAWEFGAIFAFLVAMTVFFGVVVWLVERIHNPEHFGGGWSGVGQGIWWSVVTMTTVGYGDKSPKTTLGRTVAIAWMFIGVIGLAAITGSIASKMTASRLNIHVRSPEELSHMRTGTVKGSTCEVYLMEKGISFRGYETEEDALEALVRQDIEAVVYDAPMLQYVIHHKLAGEVEVLPVRFQRQDYAFALPPGSQLREPINRTLLHILFQPRWEEITRLYLGR